MYQSGFSCRVEPPTSEVNVFAVHGKTRNIFNSSKAAIAKSMMIGHRKRMLHAFYGEDERKDMKLCSST